MEQAIKELAAGLAQRLTGRGMVMATAESCTGGWVAKVLTDIAGSSQWLDCGLVTYSNRAKQQLLGVRPQTLEGHGAVSEAVVGEMVQGALAASRADLAVAISGIAGPGGGSADKPVGTVWFAWQRTGQPLVTRCLQFGGDRETVRRQAVAEALRGLIELLDQASS